MRHQGNVAACARDRSLLEALGPSKPTSPSPILPPAGTNPQFDVAAYISQPWYVLAQQPLVYQPADQAFCTTAEYIALNETDPLEGLRVVNTARQGSTTGPVFTTANQPGARCAAPPTVAAGRCATATQLCHPATLPPCARSLLATVPDPSVPSQLEVGFDDPSGEPYPAALVICRASRGAACFAPAMAEMDEACPALA